MAEGQAAEWEARYQDYLGRLAARSKRTQDLYQEVMIRVAARELAPTALDDHRAGFVLAHGIPYANSLAALSMRFLTGLVQTGTTYSYDLVETVVPGAVPPPVTTPPDFDPGDWADWFQRLTDYAASENAGVTEMVRLVMDKVAAGEVAAVQAEAASAGFHQQHLPASVSKLVGLYLDLLGGLDELQGDYGEQYLTEVLAPANRIPGAAGAALDVAGPLGSTQPVRLAVSITAARATSVRCVVTDVRRFDGVGPAFEPEATIAPERFDLEPGEEKTVALSIRLTEGSYEPGPLYGGTFHILSPTQTLLEVPLRIRAAPAFAPVEPVPS